MTFSCVSASLHPNFPLRRTLVILHLEPKSIPPATCPHPNLSTSATSLLVPFTASSRQEFWASTIRPRTIWYLVLNRCDCLPFMLHSDQFPSQLTPFHPQWLRRAWHCVLLYTCVCSLLLRNIFSLLNYLTSPVLLPPKDSRQGKSRNGISLIFSPQIFSTLRLPRPGLWPQWLLLICLMCETLKPRQFLVWTQSLSSGEWQSYTNSRFFLPCESMVIIIYFAILNNICLCLVLLRNHKC